MDFSITPDVVTPAIQPTKEAPFASGPIQVWIQLWGLLDVTEHLIFRPGFELLGFPGRSPRRLRKRHIEEWRWSAVPADPAGPPDF